MSRRTDDTKGAGADAKGVDARGASADPDPERGFIVPGGRFVAGDFRRSINTRQRQRALETNLQSEQKRNILEVLNDMNKNRVSQGKLVHSHMNKLDEAHTKRDYNEAVWYFETLQSAAQDFVGISLQIMDLLRAKDYESIDVVSIENMVNTELCDMEGLVHNYVKTYKPLYSSGGVHSDPPKLPAEDEYMESMYRLNSAEEQPATLEQSGMEEPPRSPTVYAGESYEVDSIGFLSEHSEIFDEAKSELTHNTVTSSELARESQAINAANEAQINLDSERKIAEVELKLLKMEREANILRSRADAIVDERRSRSGSVRSRSTSRSRSGSYRLTVAGSASKTSNDRAEEWAQQQRDIRSESPARKSSGLVPSPSPSNRDRIAPSPSNRDQVCSIA